MVVETGMLDRAVRVLHGIRAQIDVRRKQLLDQRPERVGLRQPWDLVAKLEIFQDVLDVW